MLRIWGRANSINVKKVLWCATELGIEFERIDAGGKFGIVNTEEYRKLNPNALVPCIEDDGFVLWESHSILRYLISRYGEMTTLSPATLEGRASADKWLDWSISNLMLNYSPLIIQLVRTPSDQRDYEAVAGASQRFHQALAIVDAELEKSPWMSGDNFGIADFPLGAFVASWARLPELERPLLPALENWLLRLKERPGFKQWVDVPLS